jgi:hypothetical protein
VRDTLESPCGAVPVRLAAREIRPALSLGEARDLPFSSYVRWAALEAASDQLQREKPQTRPKPVVPERMPTIFDAERERPSLEDEPWLPQSFDADGQCRGGLIQRSPWPRPLLHGHSI